ncbi:transcription elongation factor GreA [Clostridia bacterium]|nr:transcription elongation factor GreA [Clostridia bacterium]
MDNKQVLLTAEGLKKYEEELAYYENVKRHDVAERIKVAISFGDISENSEYEDAKNEQAFIEGKIQELKKKLSNVKIIEENVGEDKVSIGTKVLLEDLELNEQVEYTIVGSMEADPSMNKISNESPVGKAVLGNKSGMIVKVPTPEGDLEYKIIGVMH